METVGSSFGKGLFALTVFKRVVKIYTTLDVRKIVTMTVKIIELVSKVFGFYSELKRKVMHTHL